MSGVLAGLLFSRASAFLFSRTISATTTNYNLRAAAVAAGWNQLAPLIAEISIGAGIVVGSTSTGAYAFDTGASFPAGSRLSLVIGNGAYVVGAGGAGGGGAGGPALRAQYPLSVTSVGTIGGGGKGGSIYYSSQVSGAYAGGGGGAGYFAGAGQGGNTNGSPFISASVSGAGGTLTSGGAGGSLTVTDPCSGSVRESVAAENGTGLGGGAAVVGNANITWVATGTRLGSIS